jgi:hypothetical protein
MEYESHARPYRNLAASLNPAKTLKNRPFFARIIAAVSSIRVSCGQRNCSAAISTIHH